jgi:hypothetical protein
MTKENLILLGLIIILGIVIGIFIGWHIYHPSRSVEVRTSVITIPSQSSSGISTKSKSIHDTTWVEVHDTVQTTNPECLPYQTFREDSILKVFITSYPKQRVNLDSILIKERSISHTDTTVINQYGLSWWYLPITITEAIIIILKVFNVW